MFFIRTCCIANREHNRAAGIDKNIKTVTTVSTTPIITVVLILPVIITSSAVTRGMKLQSRKIVIL